MEAVDDDGAAFDGAKAQADELQDDVQDQEDGHDVEQVGQIGHKTLPNAQSRMGEVGKQRSRKEFVVPEQGIHVGTKKVDE